MAQTPISVRDLEPGDADWVTATLQQEWGSVWVARRGEVLDASTFPGHVAVSGDSRVGLAIVDVRGDQYEVLSLSATQEGRGVGRALMQRCFEEAQAMGSQRVWLTTTNNNVRAIYFYQRLGMNLCAFHRDGVAVSRVLKPSIPLRDEHGVAIAHELEFELVFHDQ